MGIRRQRQRGSKMMGIEVRKVVATPESYGEQQQGLVSHAATLLARVAWRGSLSFPVFTSSRSEYLSRSSRSVTRTPPTNLNGRIPSRQSCSISPLVPPIYKAASGGRIALGHAHGSDGT